MRQLFTPIVLRGWRRMLALVGWASWPIGWSAIDGQTGHLIAGVGSVFLLVAYAGELVVKRREPRNAL